MNHLLRRLVLGSILLLLLPWLTFTALRAQPEPIAQVSPPPGADDVWLGTTIRITFAVPMDRTSVESHFVIDPSVTGTFVWSTTPQGETVEFRPNDILPASTTFHVTLQAGLRDAAGRVVLDTDYTWSFTTRQVSDTINFGYGLPIQLVDPDGRNRVRFWPGYPRIRVNFALYELPVSDFAARYANLDARGYQPIDITGLTEVAAWQQDYSDEESPSDQEATLPSVSSGIYVLVARHPHAGQDELIVIVSRYVLALKRNATQQVIAWAVRLQDQTPADEVAVSLYDDEGASITQGTTNADGVVELDAGGGEPRLAIGQLGGEITVAGLDSAWHTRDGYWYWRRNTDAYRVYLYTDRPIYRPGHTVHFAAILRRDQGGAYTPIEASQPITATLRDSRNNVVDTQVLSTDDFGTMNGNFTLAAEPPMGTYHIELDVDGEIYRQEFRVEAYRKPEYQVDVTTPVSYAVAGDEVPVTVEADYFFGQPVAGADVVLKIFRRSGYGYWWGPNYGEQIAELRGTTDSDGRWTTTLTTDDLRQAAVYTFVATVTDASQQPVEGQHVLSVYWTTFELTLTTGKYGYQSGEPVVAQITAQRHDGTPEAGESVMVTVERGYYDDSDIVAQQQVTTDAQGQAQATFTDLELGWYRITAAATDDRGRPAESTRHIWVFDPSGAGWWYSSDNELSIETDRDSYAPGDTAQLLIESRVTGVALLTVERGAVYEEQVVHIDGPATTVELPIREAFAPNIFARVHIFKPGVESDYYHSTPEGRLLVAEVELPVSAESHRLSISVAPDADQYRPGDQAAFTIQVTDAGGAPVEAQVGLALVDEAIFALSEDLSADIFETFYGRRSNTIATYDSLVPDRYYYDWGVPEHDGTPTPSPTGTPSPTATPGPAAPREDTGQNLRQEFRDTAYWNPTIGTGADGQAVVTVTLPDNLTTWRVIARAVTLDTQVGDTTTRILVTQDIIARPALPRFTVLGDRFALDTVAQNFSGQDVTGTVSLDAPHLVVLDPGLRSADLPNAGTDVARWTAVASEVGTGKITCAVDTPAGSDAVELPLRTKPFAVPERWSAAGQANPTATERFDVPFNAVHEATELILRLSPSVALGVLDGLDALIDYPYGCVEQTMSRVLPSAVAARTYRELGIPNPKADELPDIIQQGVQRLYGFQHEDGSWGWWYDDSAGTYMTAYVLFGLTMVQQAGFDVESSVLERGFTYLDRHLGSVDDPRITAYILYVKSVAGRGDLAAAQALLSEKEKLDPFARAALALTLNAEGDPTSAQMLADDLIAEAVETPSTAHWPADRSAHWEYYWRTMASAEKNTAMALRALVVLRPDHRLLPKAVRWLMDHRQGAGWRNTQATAFAVLGLTDYIQVSGELQADYTYTVTLNGQEVAAGQVTPETVTESIAPVVIAGIELQGDENELRIERDGPGQLYYTLALSLELFYDSFEPVSSIDQGLSISRSYRLVEGDRRADGAYNVGDLVEVQLTVEAQAEAWYVVIEDPLPAGFEALNERINPVAYGDASTPRYWYEWGYNRKDIYDDRVTFFVTQLWPGTHAYTYLMRATTPGEFSALPAQAYPMYAAEMWGRSASHQVHIAPDALTPRPALTGDFDRNCRITTFDTWQVAGVWRTANSVRDLNDNGRVDVQDVAIVASRQGATCLADRALPGVGEGSAEFTIAPEVEAVPVGQTFNVDILLEHTADLGGFGVALTFDPARLRVAEVIIDPALTDVLSLGPRIDNEAGQVAVGAFGLPPGLTGGSKLATIAFVGRRAGQAEFEVESVEAVDSEGRTLEAGVSADGYATIEGVTYFFPLLRR